MNVNESWRTLENIIGITELKRKFNAYGWYDDDVFRIGKRDHWHGWYNECYDLVSIWPVSREGKTKLNEVVKVFTDQGWNVTPIINGGISLSYSTMTTEEVDKRCYENLLAGGRMSD